MRTCQEGHLYRMCWVGLQCVENDDIALKGGASLIAWYKAKVPMRSLFTAQKTTLTRIISKIQGHIGRVRRFELKAKLYQQSEARGHTGKRTVATTPCFTTNVVHGVQSPPDAPMPIRVTESRRFGYGQPSSKCEPDARREAKTHATDKARIPSQPCTQSHRGRENARR